MGKIICQDDVRHLSALLGMAAYFFSDDGTVPVLQISRQAFMELLDNLPPEYRESRSGDAIMLGSIKVAIVTREPPPPPPPPHIFRLPDWRLIMEASRNHHGGIGHE